MNFQFHLFVEGTVRRCILTEPGMAVGSQTEDALESGDFMTDSGLPNELCAETEATLCEELDQAFEFDNDIPNPVNKTTTSDVSGRMFDAELELLDAVCWWVRGDVLRADFGLEGEIVATLVRAELPSPFYEDFGGEDPDYQNHPNLDKFLGRCY